jgi:hypothetical protein
MRQMHLRKRPVDEEQRGWCGADQAFVFEHRN